MARKDTAPRMLLRFATKGGPSEGRTLLRANGRGAPGPLTSRSATTILAMVDGATRCFRGLVRTIFAALVLGGLMRPAEAATRIPTHVACVGDSITAGYGASSSNASYPTVLQGL